MRVRTFGDLTYLVSGAFSLLTSLLIALHLLLSLFFMGRFTAGRMELSFLDTNFFCEGLAEGAVKDVSWSAFRVAMIEHIGCSSLRGEKYETSYVTTDHKLALGSFRYR